MNKNALVAMLGLATGLNMSCGIYYSARAISRENTLREAIYSHAESVTLDVIKEAEEIPCKRSEDPYWVATGYFSLASMVGALALKEILDSK